MSALHLVQLAVMQGFAPAMALLGSMARQTGLAAVGAYWEARARAGGASTAEAEVEFTKFAARRAGDLAGPSAGPGLTESLRALENGEVSSLIAAAEFYDFGVGVPVSPPLALALWEKAAARGDANAQMHTALRYLAGYAPTKGIREAVEMLGRSAAQGQTRAVFELSKIYLNPQSGFTDSAQGRSLLLRAASEGLSAAQSTLGMMYFHGRAVEKDLEISKSWIEKAAAQDFPAALYQLSWMYGTGTGVNQDLALAVKLLKRAAELGDAQAREILASREQS